MQDTNIQEILDALVSSESNAAAFSEYWSQGRSAYGGLSAAFAVTAMRKQLAETQPIRSLMVSFIAPVEPGQFTVDAEIVRQGRNVIQCSAEVMSQGRVGLQAMAAFGNPRQAFNPPPAPMRALPDRNTGLAFSSRSERGPTFLQNFDGFWMDGGIPFTGEYKPYLKMWVRHKQDMSRYPSEKLVSIADIPPPLLLSNFEEPPVPASSLTWSLDFIEPPESVESEWFYLDFEVDGAGNGYTQQSGKIYDERGKLIALTRQCMVYFG